MPESDSHGAPTDTTGQGIERSDAKRPRKQSTGKKKLKDADHENAEEKVDCDLFDLDTR